MAQQLVVRRAACELLCELHPPPHIKRNWPKEMEIAALGHCPREKTGNKGDGGRWRAGGDGFFLAREVKARWCVQRQRAGPGVGAIRNCTCSRLRS
jgi:hypothetical protein